MTDDFDDYIAGEQTIHVSTDEDALLVWGEGEGASASLLGFSYNTSTPFNEVASEPRVQMMKRLSEENDVPLVWIGTSSIESGSLDLGVVKDGANGSLSLDGDQVDLVDAPARIQSLFGTDYDTMGTGKGKNKRTAGGFHDWSRENLPREFKKQDLDIIVTSDGIEPLYIVELKRSYIDLDEWTPWRDDLRNYVLQVQTASGIGAVPVIVYQNKEAITDDSRVTLFRIDDLSPQSSTGWIDTTRENELRAEEIKMRFLANDLEL